MIADVAVPVRNTRPGNRAEQAQRELARRRLAQRHLIDFCCYVDHGAARPDAEDPFVQNYYRSPHLRLIAEYIERAVGGTLWEGIPGAGKKILFITTPPGHWKSSLVSRKFPAWFVGKRYGAGLPYQVILSSYNSTVAQGNNAKVLELIQENKHYHRLFPEIKLSPKSQSSEEWSLAGESFVACKAAGRKGGLTGYHGSVIVIDDPIKDRQEANSPTVREELWSFVKDVARTRLLKDDLSFILGIWTRWTEDDPIGRMMEEVQAGTSEERIVVLRLPALAETRKEREAAAKMGLPLEHVDPLGREPGEALWEEMESAAEHRATKRTYPITFASLYQGKPRPEGGYMAGREQFKVLPIMPEKKVRWVWATDWAITEKEAAPKSGEPDYTGVGLIGLWQPGGDDDGRIVIGYIDRAQLELNDAKMFVRDRVLSQRAPVYANSYGRQRAHDYLGLDGLRRDPLLFNYRIKSLRLKGDKVTLAQPWLERAQAGLVYVVQGDWNEDFFREVENFPHGENDDQVDLVSVGVAALGLGQKSKKATSARVPGFGR